MRRPEEPGDAPFETLGRLARAGAPPPGGAGERRARTRFLAQVARRRGPRTGLLVSLAMSALALVGWRLLEARWTALEARVLDAAPVVAIAPPVTPAPVLPAPLLAPGSVLRFADGSELRFDARGRGRIAERTAQGARVLLEEGGLVVNVVHRPDTSWRIEAGPFTVRVTGTSFRVAWDQARGRFDLAMNEGTVIVDGPTFSQRLGAGQILAASTSAGIVHLGPATTPPGRARLRQGTRPHRALATPAAVSWSRRLALGNFRGVVDEAAAAGIEQVVARRNLDDLGALATAARLSGEHEVARRALTAVRARFAGSAAAAQAAFLLGRQAEEVDHDPAAARRWFAQCYAEDPQGTLAAEALGRQLALPGPGQEATALARLYLTRFPSGPHAARARALAGSSAAK